MTAVITQGIEEFIFALILFMETKIDRNVQCYHCGETCRGEGIRIMAKSFCCEGCRMVYQLLEGKGLCDYYHLNEQPGMNQRTKVREDKFAFLDDPKICSGLIIFRNEDESHANFYLPQIHCSSCLYLLEHLHQLEAGIISSRVDFAAKEIAVVFNPSHLSLRQLAELLTSIGYEPYISLRDLAQPPPDIQRKMIYQLGIAGFCFANIMLLSFPEYLGLESSDSLFQHVFRTLNCVLSLPVLLFCAQPFYSSAWTSLRFKFLNIDAPIVLAIFVTFIRSMYDVVSGTGPGYFDSMTGIVFFMLAGRTLQKRTYRQLSFDRDYRSYFPLAVTVLPAGDDPQSGPEMIKSLPELRCGDELLIHHEEIIPADGILTRGRALIDYSFVTGESEPVQKEIGDLIYAGGRQTGAAIGVLIVKEVAQSYLTQLWNRQAKGNDVLNTSESSTFSSPSLSRTSAGVERDFSFVHALSRCFTYLVLGTAAVTGLYWWTHDQQMVWKAVTAVLIVACPCALLLSSTFTNGNILRILGKNHFYLRNAKVIESIAATTHIVFDKTGTLTGTQQQNLVYEGIPLTIDERHSISTLSAQSNHPLSRLLAGQPGTAVPAALCAYREVPGQGVEGCINGVRMAIGSLTFVTKAAFSGEAGPSDSRGTHVYAARDGNLLGYFIISNQYRKGLSALIRELSPTFHLSLLSGDNARDRSHLQRLLGHEAALLFGQTPKDKTDYIMKLQREGEKVMMIGDGLNDAGALQRSDTGIALSENRNNFTPASDSILESAQLPLLPKFIRLCRANKRIILASFILSVIYNFIGLFFAVQGHLSPLIAAILMPSSSLSILLATYGCSQLAAKRLQLV